MTIKISMVLATALLATLGGCQHDEVATQLPDRIPVASSGNLLVDTAWQLVEFQSMDDRQGTRRPANRSLYTMTLSADGSASFRLDCNRGSARWSASNDSTGRSGSLSFGPVAMTRAMCPPGSMSDRLAADIPNLRGFRVDKGQLSTSLMADGGIYIWEPMPPK